MKLRNKKTGEIKEVEKGRFLIIYKDDYEATYVTSLAELCEEWEDYEEPKGSALDLVILTLTDFIENEPDEDRVDLEDCKQMLDKLKAWKRLEEKGFDIESWDNDIGDNYYKTGQIVLNLNNVRNRDWDEYDNIMEIRQDLDLLFGGKE